MSRGARLVQAGGLLVAAILVAILVSSLFVSEETLIRRALRAMEDGYNEGAAGRVAGGFAPEFLAEKQRVARSELHGYLIRYFLVHQSIEGEPVHRVEILDEGWDVAVAEEVEPPRAEVSLRLRFEERSGAGWKEHSIASVQARLEKLDDEWQITNVLAVDGAIPGHR